MLTVWLPAELYDALDDEATRLKRATGRRVSMSSITVEELEHRLGTNGNAGPYKALEAARDALAHAKQKGSVPAVVRDSALELVLEALAGPESEAA
jgi:hypothetical protein